MEDFPSSGRPSTSVTEVNIAKVKEMVAENRHLSLRKIVPEIRRKKADLWKENLLILHHDNGTSHKAIIVNEFLAKNSTNIIEQPPYSHNMTPADFFSFQNLKLPLRGNCFQSLKDTKENSRRELKSIPENANESLISNARRTHQTL